MARLDSTVSSDSNGINHSTLCLTCLWEELLKFMVEEISSSGQSTQQDAEPLRSSTSTRLQRQSSQLLTDHYLSILIATEDQTIFLSRTLTQDGGRCSEWREDGSKISEVKSLILLVELMLNTEMYKPGPRTMVWDRDGGSSMLINLLQSQERVKLTDNSDSMFRDHSISCLTWTNIDTLTYSAKTWLSRLQMVENLRSSGSTKELRLSSLSKTMAGHSTLQEMVDLATCKCGLLTLDGGNCSHTRATTSPTFRTRRFLKLLEAEMKKDTTCKLVEEQTNTIRDGQLNIWIAWRNNQLRASTLTGD